MEKKIPEKFKAYLGSYGPQMYDGSSGEVIGWGHPIVGHLGEELWAELQRYGSLECIYGGNRQSWYLITKSLTREEAVKKYGKVTDEKFGPRGGWRSVTFGDKTFIHPFLKEIPKYS